MKKNIIICLMLSLCLTACGKTTATIDSSASTETSSEDDSGSDDVKPTFEWKGETLYLNYQAPDGNSYKDVTSEVLCGFETGHMELMPEE